MMPNSEQAYAINAQAERDDIMRTYNEMRTTVDNPPEGKTQKSTQWGPAGIGAQMTCGNIRPCVMYTPDQGAHYRGNCELGWRTLAHYQCNEWKPDSDTDPERH